MKIRLIKLWAPAAAGLGLMWLLAGCTTPTGEPNYTGTGALIGGASGATLGAMVAERAPGVGALVGGAAGLIAGGLIGQSMDQQAHAPYYGAPPPPPPLVETPPSGPGPGYVWMSGQWGWNGMAWVWSPGRWAPAPGSASRLGPGPLGARSLRLVLAAGALGVTRAPKP